jgi:CheY-like chemotaxis protein
MPSAVVVDLLLPRGDAIQVLARIRSEERLRALPVVALVPAEMSEDMMARLSESAAELCRRADHQRMPTAQLLYEEMLRDEGRLVGRGASGP